MFSQQVVFLPVLDEEQLNRSRGHRAFLRVSPRSQRTELSETATGAGSATGRAGFVRCQSVRDAGDVYPSRTDRARNGVEQHPQTCSHFYFKGIRQKVEVPLCRGGRSPRQPLTWMGIASTVMLRV